MGGVGGAAAPSTLDRKSATCAAIFVLFRQEKLPYTNERPGERLAVRPVSECKTSTKGLRHFVDALGFFMKLVEEIGEVAELLNIRTGRKGGDTEIKESLAKELADVIHYTVAIAAVNEIDLEKTIIEKDLKASMKYHHDINLVDYMDR